MSHLVYHAGTEGKIKKSDTKGLVRHTFRQTEKVYKNHSNDRINKDLTKHNVDVIFYDEKLKAEVMDAEGLFENSRQKSMVHLIEDKAKYEYRGKRPLQKNAVLAREIVSNPSRDMFEGLDIEQQKALMLEFTKDACEWMRKEFGKRNVLGYSIHLDETHPHTHFVIMPMTEDGRISQKDFFKGPADLKRQHREYRAFMNERGWNFDMENKYEAFDDVPMPVYKANAERLEQMRDKQTEALRNAQKAAESLLNDDYINNLAVRMLLDEKEEELREKLKREKEELQEQVDKLRFEVGFTSAIIDEKPKEIPPARLNEMLRACTNDSFGILRNNKTGEYALVDRRSKPLKSTRLETIVEHVYEMDGKGVTVDMKHEVTKELSYVIGHYKNFGKPISDAQAYNEGFEAVTGAVYERQKEIEREIAK